MANVATGASSFNKLAFLPRLPLASGTDRCITVQLCVHRSSMASATDNQQDSPGAQNWQNFQDHESMIAAFPSKSDFIGSSRAKLISF
jgi:hypothetical protein